MIETPVTFGSPVYWMWLGLLCFARGADLLSTWIATPNLVLEGNPIARKLGWKGGLVVNGLACAGCALIPVAAVVISTTSLLVAARNFQSAWLMRLLGEDAYRAWFSARLLEAPLGLYLLCLLGQSLLVAAIGIALLFTPIDSLPFSIGVGFVVYAIAVLLYSGLATWRVRRQRWGMRRDLSIEN